MQHNKVWTYNRIPEEKVLEISSKAGISELLAKVFLSRGIEDIHSIKKFLNSTVEDLHDPFLLKDMDRAVERIAAALERKEKIIIYGDYDVDGTTSTSLLMNFLQTLGADAEFYIPGRLEEGYGLSIGALEKIMEMKPSLIVTVDCGVTAVDEVRYIREQGIDIIITDHHECKDELPEAYAVVDPCRPDCMYPFKGLAGVGVTFKLVSALCRKLELGNKYLDYLDLVAVGTVADVVPLLGENRIIVRYGIQRIGSKPNLGLKCLIDSSGLKDKPITSWSISFVLAPRINAAGRIGDAGRAVKLFSTKDEALAVDIANELGEENKFRQDTEAEIFKQAVELVESQVDLDRERVIVLSGDDWHHGIIGIVASKITERYYRPCVLLSCENGVCKGSGRSIAGFNLFNALSHCAQYLEKYGGHELAAGLALKYENLEAFREAINHYAGLVMSESDLIPTIKVDVELGSEDVSLDNVRQLEMLAPFGAGNPSPVFAFKALKPLEYRPVGENKHVKLKLGQKASRYEAIGFHMGTRIEEMKHLELMDIVCSLEINSWNSTERVQFNLKDFMPNEELAMKRAYYSSLDECFETEDVECVSDGIELFTGFEHINDNELQSMLYESDRKRKKIAVLVHSLDSLEKLNGLLVNSFTGLKKAVEICYTDVSHGESGEIAVIVNPDAGNIELGHFDKVVFYGNWINSYYLSKLIYKVEKERVCFCSFATVSQTDLLDMVPERCDLAAVYQSIKSANQRKLRIDDLFSFSQRAADCYKVHLNYFKAKKCIEIFEELGLLKIEQRGNQQIVINLENAIQGKTELENSRLFRDLQALKYRAEEVTPVRHKVL